MWDRSRARAGLRARSYVRAHGNIQGTRGGRPPRSCNAGCSSISVPVGISAKGGAEMVRRKAPILQKPRLAALSPPGLGWRAAELAQPHHTRARAPIAPLAQGCIDE